MTDNAKPAKPDIRLYVEFYESPNYGDGSRYAHVKVRPLVWAVDKYDKSGRGMDLHDPDWVGIDVPWGSPARALKGLQATGQISGGSRDFYGLSVEYELHTVDLRQAETIVPVLRRIDKRMSALNDRFGYARDSVTWLARFADAVMPGKASPFMRRVLQGQPDIEGTGYRTMDAEGLRWYLDDQLKAWRERYGLAVPAE